MVSKLVLKQICAPGQVVHIADNRFDTVARTHEHTHDFYEFFFVKTGKLSHNVNGLRQDLARRSVCLVYPADSHWFQLHPKSSSALITNVAFYPETFEAVRAFVGTVGVRPEPHVPQVLENIESALWKSLEIDVASIAGRTDALSQSAALKTLCARILIQLGASHAQNLQNGPSSLPPPWLAKAMQQMTRKDFFVEGLERLFVLCGKSQEHVTRCMRRLTGATPSQFVNNLRLAEAARLLGVPNGTVMQVMLECGFQNSAYFIERFKQRFGCTPREYRKRCGQIVNP